MKHVVLFDRLSFQKHKLNPDGTESIEPDGPEEIVYRGHDVPDYVQDWQRSALANAGMIVPVADVPQPVAVPEPLGPPEPMGQEPGTSGAQESTGLKPTDSRAMWEDYATSPSVGMTDEEAASYPNKQALIDAVNAKTSK
jgi:hypothetical protein